MNDEWRFGGEFSFFIPTPPKAGPPLDGRVTIKKRRTSVAGAEEIEIAAER